MRLDTNILLDFALGREHADDAEKVLALGLVGAIEVCASDLSYAKWVSFFVITPRMRFIH